MVQFVLVADRLLMGERAKDHFTRARQIDAPSFPCPTFPNSSRNFPVGQH